jgi:hypothetical protein
MGETRTATGQRDRSPSFPFIPLKVAIERLTAFEEHHKRAPVPPDRVGSAWGMKPNTSQAAQTLAALRAFGLLETQRGEGGRVVVVSDDGRTYLRAQQDSIKQEVLRRAALRPTQMAKYWRDWGADRPADAACLDALGLQGGFSRDVADKFLRVYDATIAYAGLRDHDKVPENEQKAEEDSSDADESDEDISTDTEPASPTLPAVKVGDYVQWTSGGVDQFKPPRRVLGFYDENHAQVFASPTGVPVSELTVVDPPEAAVSGGVTETHHPENKTASSQGGIDCTVLQRGNRIQITADVDLDGIATLKDMLGDYESILKRLAGTKAK